MRGSALCLCTAVCIGLAGCRSCDKVEQELRAREEDVRQLKEDLGRSEFHNHLLTRELTAVRGEPGPGGVVCAPSLPYPIKSVRLGRQTGGRPSDECPWHDALQVMLEPLDAEGQALKAPGALHVEVLEVTEEGTKRGLSFWRIGPDDLRSKWQSGLFTTGYLVTLPWKVWPSTEKLRVVVRFQLVDGRVFEADKDVTVRVAPEKLRKTLPVPQPEVTVPGVIVPGPGVPPGPGLPLPMPGEAIPPMPVPPDPIPPMPVPPKKESETLPPPKKETKPGGAIEGPELSRGQNKGPVRVELLRPVVLPPEE